MEKENTSKIRLLLNELAILNQPEIHDGKFIYQLDTLQRVKQLSAELYLLADKSLFGTENSSELPSEKVNDQPEPVPVQIEVPTEKVDPVANTPLESSVLEPIPIVTETPFVNQIESPIPEPEPKPIEAPVLPEVEVQQPQINNSQARANEILAKISITRRFEYINRLFGTDAQAFNNFLAEMAASSSLEKAIEKFETHSTSPNWKRNSETVSDLKQLIRKSL